MWRAGLCAVSVVLFLHSAKDFARSMGDPGQPWWFRAFSGALFLLMVVAVTVMGLETFVLFRRAL